MALSKLFLLPLILVIIVVGTIFTSYATAVLTNQVEPIFPYVSDTGTVSPASCIFGQLLHISACLFLLCVYLKYLQIKHYGALVKADVKINTYVNKIAFTFGILCCFGLDVVASFQESNEPSTHLIGAQMCFGFGTLYFCMLSKISCSMPKFSSKRMVAFRIVFCTLCILTCMGHVATGTLAILKYRGPEKGAVLKWREEHGGWRLHIASTFSEWILVFSFCVLVASYVPEFSKIELSAPVFIFKETEITKRENLPEKNFQGSKFEE